MLKFGFFVLYPFNSYLRFVLSWALVSRTGASSGNMISLFSVNSS